MSKHKSEDYKITAVLIMEYCMCSLGKKMTIMYSENLLYYVLYLIQNCICLFNTRTNMM